MSDFNALKFVADNAGLNIFKALEKAYEQGKKDAKAEAIPLDWIRAYISNLKAMGVQLSLRDAQAVSVMVDKWAMEQNGNATCGPDYCEIGGQHD